MTIEEARRKLAELEMLIRLVSFTPDKATLNAQADELRLKIKALERGYSVGP